MTKPTKTMHTLAHLGFLGIIWGVVANINMCQEWCWAIKKMDI